MKISSFLVDSVDVGSHSGLTQLTLSLLNVESHQMLSLAQRRVSLNVELICQKWDHNSMGHRWMKNKFEYVGEFKNKIENTWKALEYVDLIHAKNKTKNLIQAHL